MKRIVELDFIKALAIMMGSHSSYILSSSCWSYVLFNTKVSQVKIHKRDLT